jgi:uncharacterized protein involved in exopolysaccharide biosynthesis
VEWNLLKEYLQEQIQQTQQELEVATSEQEMYRSQGKLISLRRLLCLEDQFKTNKDNKTRGYFNFKS